MVGPYIKSFIMNQFLHDLIGPGLCCGCGGYCSDMGDNGFKCHYLTNKCSYGT
jgi:hypothetical protein